MTKSSLVKVIYELLQSSHWSVSMPCDEQKNWRAHACYDEPYYNE